MMKNMTMKSLFVRAAALACLLVCLWAQALAYDAGIAANWMEQFAGALTALAPVNDPAQTTDPARAGQYLLEYEFGTVLSRVKENPTAQDILEIDVRTGQVTDCRGTRVGMRLEQALGGAAPAVGAAMLQVLSAQETGYGWSWAYVGENGVYGVEYIAYSENGAAMKEYTLTYVIENDVITAIRMKTADATLAQAQDGLETAKEIASRQNAEMTIAANNRSALDAQSLQVNGTKALGVPVAQLVGAMGEPRDIQTLPEGAGRILLYDGAVVTLGFNEMIGEEIVRAVSVSSDAFEGPNRLLVGMTLREAGSLVRCDQNVYSRGGTLYLAGEASGEAPYGELKAVSANEAMLIYACQAEGDTALLQVIAVDGRVTSWQMMYMSDMQGGV